MTRAHPPMLALALGLAAAGCSRGTPAAPAPAPPQVGVVTLAAAPVTVADELTGRTAATMAADVRPQVDGVIRARLFREGSVVRAGQPLYRIDPRLYRASLDTARANLENAQAAVLTAQAKADRYATLSATQAVSRQDIDDAVATAREARANVHLYRAAIASAQVNLEYTRVLAPITGRIGRSAVTPGALVSAAQTDALATIQQLDPIYVDIAQSSADFLRLRRALAKGSVLPTSAKVRLKLEDGSDYPQPGTIEFSEVDVDTQAGTVTLRARFPNPDGLLLPGMFVRVEAPGGVVPNAILAPQQGISRDAKGDATALVVGADGKIVQRSVTASRAIGASWLVTAGLKAGDRLIVEGIDRAAVGSVVRPVAVAAGS